jgi:hypothetical protein
VSKQLLDQEVQVNRSDEYDDSQPSGSTLQTSAENLRDDLNALRSQIKRILYGSGFGKWYDAPVTDLQSLLSALGDSSKVTSSNGQYAVPFTAAIKNLVYASGNNEAGIADNTSILTAPVIGIIIDKPSTITATIAYFGVISGFTGLIAGDDIFLGVSGGIIKPPLPSTPGTIIQKIGQVLNSTTILFDPDNPIIM